MPRLNVPLYDDIHCTLQNYAKYIGAQRYRALMVILQSHRTQNMILRCYPNVAICYTSEIYQILSPVLFQRSLYFPFLIHRISYLLVSALFLLDSSIYTWHFSILGQKCMSYNIIATQHTRLSSGCMSI